MRWYPLLVFLHVLAAVGIFAAWGIEAVLLQRLRRSVTVEEARTAALQLRKRARAAPSAMLIALATGMTMGAQWGHQAWMTAAFAALVGIAVIGIASGRRAGPRLAAILSAETERTATDVAAAAHFLAMSLQLRVAIGVGIIGLMTMKPDARGSLLVLALASVVGVVVAVREAVRHEASARREATLQSPR